MIDKTSRSLSKKRVNFINVHTDENNAPLSDSRNLVDTNSDVRGESRSVGSQNSVRVLEVHIPSTEAENA